MRPVFLTEVPAGTYRLRLVEDPNGSPTNHDLSLVIPRHRYAIPDDTHALSLWDILLDAHETAFGGSRPTLSVTADDTAGWQVTVNEGGVEFKWDYTNTPVTDDGKLPLTWLGFELTDYTSAMKSVIPPKYSWFPKQIFPDRRVIPVTLPVATTGLTADGTTFGVNQGDGTIQKWATFRSVGGIRAARLSTVDANDSYLDYLTATGITSGKLQTWHSLDGADGWWARTVGGKWNFLVVRDESDLTSADGEHVICYDEDAPIGMGGWRGLRTRTLQGNAGATENVTFAALRT